MPPYNVFWIQSQYVVEKLQPLLPVTTPDDTSSVALRNDLHVVARLVVRRDSVVLINCAFTGVVTRERELNVSGKSFQQPTQILCSRINILDGIVWIVATKTFRCRRHQLHQPLSAGMRARVLYRTSIPARSPRE